MMANEEVSTAALPMPFTTRSARQAAVKAVGSCSRVTSPKAAADSAQMTWPISKSVFLRTALGRRQWQEVRLRSRLLYTCNLMTDVFTFFTFTYLVYSILHLT